MTEKVNRIPELFGCMVFNERAMERYVPAAAMQGWRDSLKTGKPLQLSVANDIADAMKTWALERGATHYTHWFQPMTGITAEKHDSFIKNAGGGRVIMDFSGSQLVCGEPDASSFPTGGLRATFEARGYSAWDPTAFAFLKDGSLCIPTVFCSYGGAALDKKTPLLRSMESVNREAVRALRLFGDEEVTRVTPQVGAEQEYFLIDRDMFNKREDLRLCGRTLFGTKPPKGQELDDHYFGVIRPRVAEYMRDLDEELWKLGVLSKTKHNEVAPAQHEMAPIYTDANTASDQNQLVMETMKKVAERHGMVCLLHMEIGERNLDFLPACFRRHMLNALPVSTCSIYKLERSVPIAAIGQNPEVNAVKACPVCTVQLLGRSAVTCSAVCNGIFVLHCIAAILGMFGIQRNRQRIPTAVPVVCRCQFGIICIGFKVVNHTFCLRFCVGVNHAYQNSWLIAVGGQNGNLIVAQFQPLQNLCGNRNHIVFHRIICALGQHLVAKLYTGNAAQFHRCPQLNICRLYNIKICFLRGNTVLCILGIHPLCVCHDGIASILCRVAICIALIIHGIAVIILIQGSISGQRCQHPVICSGIFNALIGVPLEDVEPFIVNVCSFTLVFPAKFFYDNRFIHCYCIFAVLLEPEVSLFLGQAPLIAVNMNRSVVDIR